jgi:nucleotide-binding universal stress UspA family protein
LKQEDLCVYSHILIPTDGSELSKMALYEGVALAKALGARVSAVTVTTPFHVFTRTPSMVTDTLEQYKKHMAARAGEYLDVAKNIAAAAGVTCDLVHLEHEQPYQAIIETAQNRGCDAIHMASHGRRGISAILLGSETLKVLTHSAIPVIVCRRQRPATLFQESFAAS